jgi:protein-disulfide isomerase
MSDLKMVLIIIGASIAIVLVMIFGLSKISNDGGTKAEVNTLLEGAKLSTQSGEVKATVVVFSDMQCPACKAADRLIGGLANTEGVLFVMRHFPLMGHKYSTNGAKAVEAARQMNKGWEMVGLLFEKQEEWSGVGGKEIDSRLADYAVSLGLERVEYETRLKSTETAEVVSGDKLLGERLRLSGTPTIFVNGEQVSPEFVMGKVNELLTK